jgi:hypothetical protein
MGPIPSGATVEQQTDGVSRRHIDEMTAKAEAAIDRVLGGLKDDITVTINAMGDGRSIDIGVSDDRLPCEGDADDPRPEEAVVALVQRAAAPQFPGLIVETQGTAGCFPDLAP